MSLEWQQDEAAAGAKAVVDAEALRGFVLGPLAAALPHKAMMCGLMIAHSGGYLVVQRFAFGLSPGYVSTNSVAGYNLRSPVFTRLLRSGGPLFFDAARDGGPMPPDWLANFKAEGLHNVFGLSLREGDDDEGVLSSAGFYNVSPDCERRAADIQRALMPPLHAALVRIHAAASAAPKVCVTHGERVILDLLLEGKSNKEIGKKLGRSDETVKARLADLMHRLRVRNRTELVALLSRSTIQERPGKRDRNP